MSLCVLRLPPKNIFFLQRTYSWTNYLLPCFHSLSCGEQMQNLLHEKVSAIVGSNSAFSGSNCSIQQRTGVNKILDFLPQGLKAMTPTGDRAQSLDINSSRWEVIIPEATGRLLCSFSGTRSRHKIDRGCIIDLLIREMDERKSKQKR